MGENDCITMADSRENSTSDLKENIPYLKDHKVDSEVALGILLHLFLFLCFIILLYLLVRQFM